MVNGLSIHGIFERQSEATPENVALKYGRHQITYRELNAASNRLARVIQDYGIQKGDYVGIYLDKGIAAVTAMLAILKAGGAFVILDRNWPLDRIGNILRESAVKLMIAAREDAALEMLSNSGGIFVPELLLLCESSFMGADKSSLDQQANLAYDQDNLGIEVDQDSAAHIYFTSGTTGKFKGIIGPHSLLVQLSIRLRETFGYTQNDVFSQLSSLSFDSSLRDIFTPLLCGATVCIPTKEISSDLCKIATWLDDEKITVVQSVPSIFNILERSIRTMSQKPRYKAMRYYFQAGESLHIHNLIRWQADYPHVELINLYGTTETMVKSFYRIKSDRLSYLNAIPIGMPFPGTELLIIKDGRICGTHQVGMLFIRSNYIAKGYLNNESLTKQKFVQNPLQNVYKEIVYDTGDLAKYLPDGNVQLLGRNDNQVKIQGVRIEIDELESIVKQIEGVEEAVFVLREDGDSPEVLLFIVSDKKYSHNQITAYLADKIPVVAMPSKVIFIDHIPLNSNGKLDKQYLCRYPIDNCHEITESVAENPNCQMLIEIWEDVLHQSGIHPDNNFFSLGGDSLSAMKIISLMKSRMNREIKFVDFFRNPSIRMLADLISRTDEISDTTPIKPLPTQEFYQASYAQKRFWFLNQLDRHGISSNITISLRVYGHIDIVRYKRAVDLTMEKHEILRTCFINLNNEIKQRIETPSHIAADVRFDSLLGIARGEHRIDEWIEEICYMPFQLNKAPLWRSGFLECDADSYVFVICIHHIICDGWSLNILFRDIMQNYNALLNGIAETEKLFFQYKEYAAWQKQIYEKENNADRLFWLEEMREKPSIVDLPTDFARPAVNSFLGSYIVHDYSMSQAQKIREFCVESETSLFALLLTCLNILIFKYTAQRDIVVGAPMSGRDIAGVENQIGAYINTLPIRSKLDDQMPIHLFLSEIKKRLNKIYEHQNYPIDKLVQDLRLPYDSSHNPLFDIVLTMQNQGRIDADVPGVAFERMRLANPSSKFDLSIIFMEDEEGLTGKFEYNTDLYTKATMERIVHHFNTILNTVLLNGSMPIGDISIATEEEKKYVLEIFNRQNDDVSIKESAAVLFEKNVRKYGNRICVVDGLVTYTFDEINAKSNQLARYIRKNVGPDCKAVCIYLDRSSDYIISVLAAMKAGMSFVPLDTNSPWSRNQYIMQNVGASHVLTRKGTRGEKLGAGIPIDVCDDSINFFDDKNLNIRSGLDDTAYILYTSGTTGKPKGVKIPHHGLANYCIWASECYIHADRGNFAFFTSVAFDLTITSVFLPLITGHKIIIFSQDNVLEQLMAIFTHSDVDIVKLTPSHLHIYMKLLKENTDFMQSKRSRSEKILILGGENLRTDLAAEAQAVIGGSIYNEYGPTEAVVGCMLRKYDDNIEGEYVPIGRPAFNTRVFVLDDRKRICPFGVCGELYIERIGISSGYVGLPEETKKRFVDNPFSKDQRLLYRTGDLAYMTRNGEMAFAGRVDDQVKISGYRIELKEIESVIEQYTGVLDVAVLKAKDDEALYAYLVTRQEITLGSLIVYLRSKLPGYMVPVNFYKVDSIPLNANGKRDFEQLKATAELISHVGSERADMTNYHSILIKECETLLGKRLTQSDVNFFDLGMRSLTAVQLVENIKSKYGIEIPAAAIFMYPSIDKLGDYISHLEEGILLEDGLFEAGEKNGFEVYKKLRQRKNERDNLELFL